MTNRQILIITAVALVSGVAIGRFLTPTKVETRTILQESKLDTKDSDLERNRHKETVVKETVRPDGTKKTTSRTVEDSNTKQKKAETSVAVKTEEKSKVVENDSSRVTVMGLAAIDVRNPGKIDYGLMVCRPILGPFTLGAFGYKSGTVGVSFGLQF